MLPNRSERQFDDDVTINISILSEFGEIPPGSVSVYITVLPEQVEAIAHEGLTHKKDNERHDRHIKANKFFDEIAREMGISVQRAESIFAFPRDPEKVEYQLLPNQSARVVMEAKIDPRTAWVVDAILYVEGENCLWSGDVGKAKDFAAAYWSTAKPLVTYLQEGHVGDEDDHDDFYVPEVLISHDINSAHLKITR